MQAETSFSFPRAPRDYAKRPAPSLAEWHDVWRAWDLTTRQLIPEEALLSKPIHLRNCCIFYLGHIPAFLDKNICRGTDQPPTEPAHFTPLFERGIDPDVDNPAKCHAHSAIPDQWPPLEEILQYQRNVRERIETLYEHGQDRNPRVARSLWIGFEHEAMHLETLLYMLMQSETTRAPPGPKPDFAALAAEAAEAEARRSKGERWMHVPTQTISLGMDDPETDNGPERFFGWDVEKPARKAKVPGFTASTRAITNGEYARYLEACNIQKYPMSWKVGAANGEATNGAITNGHTKSNGTTAVNGTAVNAASTNGGEAHVSSSDKASAGFIAGKAVRTLYGPVPLQQALDWPVMASYDELNGCASWMGGRIPFMEEVQSLYAYVETMHCKKLSDKNSRTIPATDADLSHLSNEGVEEDPPFPSSLFADLAYANVGFRAFHPMPPALLSPLPAGRAGLGGVWEWTSTPLARHEGYSPMPAYPEYSSDFFDDKHNVVLGGSWATLPRLAGRRSFVNWYQRNYPYAWCGARLVRDLPA